jgi:general secretion pathway protein C
MNIEWLELKKYLIHPLGIKILCALLSGLIAYELVTGIIADLQIRKIVAQPIIRKVSRSSTNSELPASARGHLFGMDKNVSDAGIAPSFLKINLVGLVYDPLSKNSEVIIHTPSGTDKIYHIGDLLPGGIKIDNITQNSILVIRDGNLESISLPK